MAEILFNNAGVPLIACGKSYQASTTGTPSDKPKNVLQPKYPDEEYLIVGDTKIAVWGNNNDFPSMADQVISSVGVLNTGLKFTRNFTLGQSIFACTVTDFDESGNEVLSRVKDKSLITFANSRLVRRFMSKALRDYLKFGCAFVQVIMNADGSKMVGINTINAKYCRLSMADQNGVIQKCVVSGKWPHTPGEGFYQVYDLLDEYDPFADPQRRRYGNKVAGKSFIYVIRELIMIL